MPVCVTCKLDKEPTEFQVHKSATGLRADCRVCRAHQDRLRKYGITTDEYLALQEAQLGLCAICENDIADKAVVDHDHFCCAGTKSCGKCIRGLLCDQCNLALGLLGDDPDILDRAIRYLTREKDSDRGE